MRRASARVRKILCAENGGLGYQVIDDKVIFFGGRVLVVGDRIDARGEGDLPGFLGDVLDRCQSFNCKHIAAFRRDHKQDVVILVEGVLHFLKSQQLGIVVAEEHAVVITETQFLRTVSDDHYRRYRQQHNGVAPADNDLRV